MSEVKSQAAGFRFDDFYIDAANRQLWRGDRLLALNSRYFDVLLLLVTNSRRLVEKQRIFEEVWSGVFVTDAALTQCIKDIRKQLGDDASNPRYIKTVPKHGYIFIGNAIDCYEPQARESSQSLGATFASVDESLRGAENKQPQAATEREHSSISRRPYKFLDYYAEQDSALFFGREAEVEFISSQVLAHRSFILHGRSGVGKSSILRAGVMPRLKAEGHHVFVIRSFTGPLHQMKSALRLSLGAMSEDSAGVDEMLRELAEREPKRLAVFFLDQFEEFFTLLDEESRGDFLRAIGKMFAADHLPFRLVFALREDMLAEMSQLKGAAPEIFHHECRLKRLNRAQAAAAITRPASTVGCHYESELVERLLDDLSDAGTIDPPQLQIVCDNLYDSRDSNGSLTLATYERLGTASQILAGYLERVLHRFNSNDLQTARQILTSLISITGERLVLKVSELETRVAGRRAEGRELAGKVVEELVAARIVRRRSQDGEAWLELAHDFLTAEISRWLTADEVALKRARGVVERAMENYLAHGLMIDADVLDLVLPFGEQLRLTGEEGDLVMMSALSRARPIPPWLVESSPRAARLISDSCKSGESVARLRAVEAASLLRGEEMKALLVRLALWDKDLLVRKAATVALTDWLGEAAQEILSNGERAGAVRRAISLAMIRDYDKRLVKLSRASLTVAVLIVCGLIWVRLRRGGAEMVRQGIGGTLGGAASGIVGGLMLAMGLSAARHATALEASSLMLVLVSMGFFIGAIGGFGVSFGMLAAERVAYRHSRWWSVVGAAAGGALVGGSSKLLGVDTVRALFGRTPDGITGAFEGAVIGMSLSLGAVLVGWWMPRSRGWQRVAGASVGAMCAGILLTVIGGNLFSGSLEIVARMFADSQIRMEPLASFFGEVHFGQTSQVIMGALEGLLFGAGVMSGSEMLRRASNMDNTTPPASITK